MNDNLKYYLGIDWGTRKIGFAIADNETKIATALKTVDTKVFWQALADLSERFLIERIIIGSYLDEDKFNINNPKIKKFLVELEKKINVVIEQAYEGFSTRIARQNLRQKGSNESQDDAESARIILQGWLDSNS